MKLPAIPSWQKVLTTFVIVGASIWLFNTLANSGNKVALTVVNGSRKA